MASATVLFPSTAAATATTTTTTSTNTATTTTTVATTASPSFNHSQLHLFNSILSNNKLSHNNNNNNNNNSIHYSPPTLQQIIALKDSLIARSSSSSSQSVAAQISNSNPISNSNSNDSTPNLQDSSDLFLEFSPALKPSASATAADTPITSARAGRGESLGDKVSLPENSGDLLSSQHSDQDLFALDWDLGMGVYSLDSNADMLHAIPSTESSNEKNQFDFDTLFSSFDDSTTVSMDLVQPMPVDNVVYVQDTEDTSRDDGFDDPLRLEEDADEEDLDFEEPEEEMESKEEASAAAPLVKRRRGRPRKEVAPASAEVARRPRGRPRKVVSGEVQGTSNVLAKKRKAEEEQSKDEVEVVSEKVFVVTKRPPANHEDDDLDDDAMSYLMKMAEAAVAEAAARGGVKNKFVASTAVAPLLSRPLRVDEAKGLSLHGFKPVRPMDPQLAKEYLFLRDGGLGPKERRQLRNKLSARSFRERRKEYIDTLEFELVRMAEDHVSMEEELRVVKEERDAYQQRVSELESLVASLSMTTAITVAANDEKLKLAEETKGAASGSFPSSSKPGTIVRKVPSAVSDCRLRQRGNGTGTNLMRPSITVHSVTVPDIPIPEDSPVDMVSQWLASQQLQEQEHVTLEEPSVSREIGEAWGWSVPEAEDHLGMDARKKLDMVAFELMTMQAEKKETFKDSLKWMFGLVNAVGSMLATSSRTADAASRFAKEDRVEESDDESRSDSETLCGDEPFLAEQEEVSAVSSMNDEEDDESSVIGDGEVAEEGMELIAGMLLALGLRNENLVEGV